MTDMITEISNYVLGHKRATEITIGKGERMSSVDEEVVLYRGYAFKTEEEFRDFASKSLDGSTQDGVYKAVLNAESISSWTSSEHKATDFCFGAGRDYYESTDEIYPYSIVLCIECGPESIIVSCEDVLSGFAEDVKTNIKNDSEYILCPGRYDDVEIYKCSREVARILGVTNEIYMFEDDDD